MQFRSFAVAAVAALAFGGFAQAGSITCNSGDTCISETVNGVITGGIDTRGTFSAAGTDLTGDFITATFIYNLTSLNSASSAPTYTDSTADSSIYVAITLSGANITNTGTLSLVNGAGTLFGELADCQSSCGGAPYLESFVNVNNVNYEAIYLYNATALASADLASQAALDSYVSTLGAGACTGGLPASNGCVNVNGDGFTFNATPEPATWFSLALGLGSIGMARRKFRPCGPDAN